MCNFVPITFRQVKRLTYLLIIFTQILLVSCGDNSEFSVAGEITGMGTQNLRIFYYADGAVHSVTSAALDGKFRFSGKSRNPAIVEIFSSNRTFIGRVLVKNGEELECRFDKNNRYNVSIKGNGTSAEWGKFLTGNATTLSSGDYRLINSAIAEYVVKHPDNLLSTILLLTEYHVPDNEQSADSLLNTINPDACPGYLVDGFRAQLAALSSDAAQGEIFPMNLYCSDDSLFSFNPAHSRLSVICFTASAEERTGSIVPAMHTWSETFKPSLLRIVDISLATDTATWYKTIKDDSPQWVQCWAPGSVASHSIERLSIPRTPYFIVADSIGRQVYRGMSLSEVQRIINDSIPHK